MSGQRFLVVGVTGRVGSKITVLLADRGYHVTALVRSDGATIRDPHEGTVHYVTGNLADEESIAEAVRGVDVVISPPTASSRRNNRTPPPASMTTPSD